MEAIKCGPTKRIISSSLSYRTTCRQVRYLHTSRKNESDSALNHLIKHDAQPVGFKSLPPLSIMPTSMLLRSLMITSILSSPRLLNLCMPFMKAMASSKSLLLSPDRNPVLHTLTRKLFYDHFCAGENATQVKQVVKSMRDLGYKGVILGYAKEIVVPQSQKIPSSAAKEVERIDPIIEDWRAGTLETLEMIGDGDFLAIKFTGAGPAIIEALAEGRPMPEQFRTGLEHICAEAARRDTLIWIDAEQQRFQETIDQWTIELMRKYNTPSKARIYNTIQAYLKGAPDNIRRHLQLAANEGWAVGFKLVRGAYIASEPRHLIHDTKEDTDAAYDACTADLLAQNFPAFKGDKFPKVELFLASHNDASVKKACQIQRQRVLADQPLTPLGYGQLQGMADEISCELLQMCRQSDTAEERTQVALRPQTFKFLSWGTVQECMQYLLRRAVENQGAIERTRQWAGAFRGELWRRMVTMGR